MTNLKKASERGNKNKTLWTYILGKNVKTNPWLALSLIQLVFMWTRP